MSNENEVKNTDTPTELVVRLEADSSSLKHYKALTDNEKAELKNSIKATKENENITHTLNTITKH